MKSLLKGMAIAAVSVTALAACKDENKGAAQAMPEVVDPAVVESVKAASAATWPSVEADPNAEIDEALARDNFMVVLDMSGSMGESRCAGKFPSKADAARVVLEQWLATVPDDANVGLVLFDSQPSRVVVPLGTSNRNGFVKAVVSTVPDGGTPLSEAVDVARRALEKQAALQQGYGNYRVVVITDGEHSNGYDPRPVIKDIMSNPANPTEIHTVGFCIEDSALRNPDLTYYQSASNPEELKKGLQSVLAEAESFDITDFQESK